MNPVLRLETDRICVTQWHSVLLLLLMKNTILMGLY